ncbi:alpha/beta fold hydrolase [Tianweitania sediminis]
MHLSFDPMTLHSATGADLRLYVSEARDARGVVQINHGLAEHAARYERFAAFLGGRGYHVLAHDHRGHGFTKAADAPRGRFAATEGAAKVIEDAASVLDLATERWPEVPQIVFGHSMGALVAIALLQSRGAALAGAAIWNGPTSAGVSLYLARTLLAWERFRMGSDVPSIVMPRATFYAWANQIPNRRTDFDWLSHDEAEVDAYAADPLCGWNGSVSLWLDLLALTESAADRQRWLNVPRSMPIQLVSGAEDPVTKGGAVVEALGKRLKQMRFSNLETTRYGGTRHEGLNELNRNIIMADFANWADRALGA